MVRLTNILLGIPQWAIFPTITACFALISILFGGGLIMRKLEKRKKDHETEIKDALEKQQLSQMIKTIQEDIVEIKKDGGRKEACIKDIERLVNKMQIIFAQHLKIDIKD